MVKPQTPELMVMSTYLTIHAKMIFSYYDELKSQVTILYKPCMIFTLKTEDAMTNLQWSKHESRASGK